ncbi:hypothetical protein POM88_020261 [Heracleum sosnowskyi]|uniref:Oxysterol-binding protein n=1 Tax=Heracleum sosnowskyi TaxID=360622 RepID=A0AAD8ICI3_9APIA|nr:hypothetical protein POM88_020261 [Heracleum sosnowskyi]
MIKESHQPTVEQRSFFEGDDDGDDEADEGRDGRERGEIRRTTEVNPRASTAQTVEDSSTKGEKEKKGEEREAGEASGGDKGKGKQSMEESAFDDAYYYHGEQDDFHFDTSGDLEKTIPEEAFGEEEVEEVANFDDWEDEADLYTPDPLFQKELKKQQAELRRKEDEQAKGNSLLRILYVAAFAVSGYASTDGKHCKPFNPMLGETYEADYPEKGLRFFSEKVSHHPTLIACHCEGKGWKFWGDSNLRSKFWGRSIQLDPLGTLTLEFDDFTYIRVHGFVEDDTGEKVATLRGKWDEHMYYTLGDRVSKTKDFSSASLLVTVW